jgi:hypothetical protein
MKVFAVLLLAAAASAEIDWANVKPVTMMDGFWDGRDPFYVSTFKAVEGQRNGRIVNGEIAAPHQFPYQVRPITTRSKILNESITKRSLC